MADKPTEILRKTKLTFSTKMDPKCCQVCESVEDIRDISMDDETKEELMRIFGKTPDKKVEHLMKHLCMSCAFKLCSINEFRQQYLATYDKLLAQIEDEDNEDAAQQKIYVGTIDAHDDVDQLPDELEESLGDIQKRFCATEGTSKQVSKSITFTCEYCEKSYKYKASLKNHIVKHVHREKSKKRTRRFKQSEVCGYKTNNRGAFKQNKKIHMDKKSHKCTNCSKCIIRSDNLISHMRIHTGEKPYKCEICLTCFRREDHLRRHMLIHSGEKPFKCEICLNSFRHMSTLKYHMRIHTGEKAFKCEICLNSFRHMNTLKNHMRIHTDEKPYRCEICLTSFRENGALKSHMKIHTDEKPHSCEICHSSFRHKFNLKTHMRIHTGEKPHKCEICLNFFRHKNSLKKHMRIHTDEKPYRCGICLSSYRHKKSLKAHMFIHSTG